MIFLNNRLVPVKQAVISVYDHGFLYGDGIYETMRAYGGTVFMLDEHIERLFRSASLIGLALNRKPDAIRKAVYATLEANRIKEALIRITVSRGAGPTGLDPQLCRRPTFVVFAHAFKKYPARYYSKGISIIIARTRRNYDKALDPGIKSLNFLNNILAKVEAIKEGAVEAVMLNYRGRVAEGTISNIFFVRDNVLCTPSPGMGILCGITRGLALECARELKIKTREGAFTPEDMNDAREVFISNTSMEIMPVRAIGEKTIRKSPGEITLRLHAAYRKKVRDYLAGSA